MAKNPFQQLRVLRNISQTEKPIYDCYRLLYQPKLLSACYDMLMKKTRMPKNITDKQKNQEIKTLIQLLRAGKFRFHPKSDPTSCQLLSIAITKCLQEILTPKFKNNIFSQINSTTIKYGINYLRENQYLSRWYLQLKIRRKITTAGRKNILEKLGLIIHDLRFLLLIDSFLKFKNGFACGELGKLLYSYLLTCLDKEINGIEPSVLFIRLHNQIIIYHQSRNDLKRISDHLTIFLKSELGLKVNDISTYLSLTSRGIRIGKVVLKNDGTGFKVNIANQAMVSAAKKYGYGNFETFVGKHRSYLVNKPATEILRIYLNELKNVRYSIAFAGNMRSYKRLCYLAKQSYLKTLAFKYRQSVRKIYFFLEENPELKFIF